MDARRCFDGSICACVVWAPSWLPASAFNEATSSPEEVARVRDLKRRLCEAKQRTKLSSMISVPGISSPRCDGEREICGSDLKSRGSTRIDVHDDGRDDGVDVAGRHATLLCCHSGSAYEDAIAAHRVVSVPAARALEYEHVDEFLDARWSPQNPRVAEVLVSWTLGIVNRKWFNERLDSYAAARFAEIAADKGWHAAPANTKSGRLAASSSASALACADKTAASRRDADVFCSLKAPRSKPASHALQRICAARASLSELAANSARTSCGESDSEVVSCFSLKSDGDDSARGRLRVRMVCAVDVDFDVDVDVNVFEASGREPAESVLSCGTKRGRGAR